MDKKSLVKKLRDSQAQYKFGTPKYDAYGQAAFFAEKLDAPKECDWVPRTGSRNARFGDCSLCHRSTIEKRDNDCPHCGAKIKKGENGK